MIELNHVCVMHWKKTILEHISHTFKTWTCTAIIGDNWAGKSCLIKTIIGQIKATKWSIKRPDHISYTADHLAMPSKITLHYLTQNHKQTKDLIKKLWLSPYYNTEYWTLSQGNKQKIHLIYSIIQKSPVIIRDEPTQHLDPNTRHTIHNIIKELKSQGKTIIYTTHFLEDIWPHTDECIIMEQWTIKIVHKNPSIHETIKGYFHY
jgi:ABC-2 type transport system ATP-binding protein